MKKENNREELQKAVVKNAPWSLSSTMATSRHCHYILLKHKSKVHNKEAILWSACFNVPLRQIKNSNLKVQNGICDEAHGGKMRAYFTGLQKR